MSATAQVDGTAGANRRTAGREEKDRLFTPVHPYRASEEIAKQIAHAIRAGKLSPGERLPSERELADRFGISRNPVREAFRTLEALGYITVKAGSGAYVLPQWQEDERVALLRTQFQARRGEINEYFEVHRALFAEAAFLAATRAREEDLNRLEAALKSQEAAVRSGDKTELLYADREFTRLVAEMARNRPLIDMVIASIDYLKRCRVTLFALPSAARAEKSIQEHRLILEAIQDRDPARAAEAARTHVMSAMHDWLVVLKDGSHG